MPSQFVMQIVDSTTGEVVAYPPGLKVEQDFLQDCTTRILQGLDALPAVDVPAFKAACTAAIRRRGVGFTKTEAHVMQDVTDGINETITDGGLNYVAEAVRQQVRGLVATAIAASIHDLKKKVQPTS
jgi:hypothetical protein